MIGIGVYYSQNSILVNFICRVYCVPGSFDLLNYKLPPAQKIVGFFHGIDTATQNDYYTDVVHVLPQKAPRINEDADRYKWLPYLVGIYRIGKREPNEIIDLQIQKFNKFPPFKCCIDATREMFLVNALTRKYGESIIEPVKFMNAGNSNTKFQLKQIGYAYLHSGYQWPDDIAIEKTHPRLAKLIRILKKEMLHEQMEYTPSGKITFNEPVGRHNDLVHGWELSLKAVMEFQQKNLGYEKRKPEHNEYSNIVDEIYKDYPTEEIISDKIYDQNPGGIGSMPY